MRCILNIFWIGQCKKSSVTLKSTVRKVSFFPLDTFRSFLCFQLFAYNMLIIFLIYASCLVFSVPHGFVVLCVSLILENSESLIFQIFLLPILFFLFYFSLSFIHLCFGNFYSPIFKFTNFFLPQQGILMRYWYTFHRHSSSLLNFHFLFLKVSIPLLKLAVWSCMLTTSSIRDFNISIFDIWVWC